MTQITYTRPWLAPYQLKSVFGEERLAVIEAATKSGKTVSSLIWLTEQAMQGKPGWNYWWLSPSLPMAKIPFTRLKRSLPQALYSTNETEVRLKLPNETYIWFKGADRPDMLYGEDVHAGVIDEASRAKEDAWIALRTTVTATRGPLRVIGNVRGRKNWAYRLGLKIREGLEDATYSRIAWQEAVEAGVLDAGEVANAQEHIPPAAFEQLYSAEAADDVGNPFGYEAILACRADEPLSGLPLCWGWDLGKVVSWTVGVGLDLSGRVVGFERFQMPWRETRNRILETCGKVEALIDSTGVGDPNLEELQRESTYQNIRGYNFTAPSKQQLMEGLANAIQAREITLPPGESPLLAELESFEYQYTRTGVRYSAPEGMHDDCVDALALAVHRWRELRRTRAQLEGIKIISMERASPWKIT